MKRLLLPLIIALSLTQGSASANPRFSTSNTRAFEYLAEDTAPAVCESDEGFDFGPNGPTDSFRIESGSIGNDECQLFRITSSNTRTSLNFVFGEIVYVTAPTAVAYRNGYDVYPVMGGKIGSYGFIPSVIEESVCFVRRDMQRAICRMAHVQTNPMTGEPLNSGGNEGNSTLREVHQSIYVY